MWINSKDYRLTYSESFSDLSSDLSNLKNKMVTEHPRMKNFYLNIKNCKAYKKDFLSAFKYRCCYCGKDLDACDVEIDHICSPDDGPQNNFDNLAPACNSCNGSKSNIVKDALFANKIHPVTNIQNCFTRNSDLTVLIAPAYTSDQFVQSFYERLNLGSQIKRLDFLVLCLDDISKRILDRDIKNEIICIKDFLSKKKRKMF